jgi:hypothetical protein
MGTLKSITCAALGFVLLLVGSCSSPEEPVATVKIQSAPSTLGYPGFAHLELQWEMLRELEGVTQPPIVFIHLISEVGEVLRTFDHVLPFDWAVGDAELDGTILFQSALAPSLPTGDYQLTMGLYDVSGRRWPLGIDGDEVGRNEYVIAELSIEEGSPPGPMFYFSPSWMDTQPGTDVQVLGVRRMTEEGTIRISDVEGRGKIFLQLQIPGPANDAEDLVLDEGAELPAVSISSECLAKSERAEGEGVHRVVLDISPGLINGEEAVADCEVVVRPNYDLLDTATLSHRALVLEVLAWSPESK